MSAARLGRSRAHLTWTSEVVPATYELERRDPGGEFRERLTLLGGKTRADDQGLLETATYAYRLRGRTTRGPSAWSNVLEVGPAALGSANRWSTLGGDIGHTGFNALETGRPPLTRAWSHPATSSPYPGGSPAVSDGPHVYRVRTGDTAVLVSLDAVSGEVLWSRDLGQVDAAGDPAVFDGVVYLGNCMGQGASVRAFDALSGRQVFIASVGCQFEHFGAPIVVQEGVFLEAGTYGGLVGLDALGGELRFSVAGAPYSTGWSPSSDGVGLYSLDPDLVSHDPVTGAISWSIPAPGNAGGRSPVIAGGEAYLVTQTGLFAVNLSTHGVRIVGPADNVNQPAVAQGVAYVVAGGAVHALDALDGGELWSFPGDGTLYAAPVLTRTHLYVASAESVYAVDLATHQQVWTGSGGGSLALAGGRLFVSRPTGELVAWTLTPGP